TLLPGVARADAGRGAATHLLPIPPTPDERWESLRRLRRSRFCPVLPIA
ncbi:MAG: glycosyltransferase family 1 protein, partial [Frankia sp.]|nr:glycosyltransferase family 1 protein [Frankia sp.]